VERSNQHRRADGSAHDGAIFCSPKCRQAAYRWRSGSVTKSSGGATTQATVTRPDDRTENIEEIRTKNGHPRLSYALYRGRSKRPVVRIVPDGVLYRIAWPDIGPSDLCNLTRAKAAALEWAQHKEAKTPTADRLLLKWSRCAAGGAR
jgi:hypothetical protein